MSTEGLRPIVFAGPSLSAVPDAEVARLDVRPPAKRGDLEALVASTTPRTVLLLDGLFGSSLAVAPMECRHLLAAGFTLCGASSMGALRASELWSLGMIGIGEIYAMLRVGGVADDDELAVAYHPDTHREITVALVHVRALLAHVGSPLADRMLALKVARSVFWMERSWNRLFEAWHVAGLPSVLAQEVRGFAGLPAMHPKARDAQLAVHCILEELWPITGQTTTPGRK
ncbi:MAG: hypothetical protein NVS3B20_09450 [Polyangiales bacterium]